MYNPSGKYSSAKIEIPSRFAETSDVVATSGKSLWPLVRICKKIQTEVAPLLKSGLKWRDKVDIENGDRMYFYFRLKQECLDIHRYYCGLIINKSRICLHDISAESNKGRIIESRDLIGIYREQNANNAANLVFANVEG